MPWVCAHCAEAFDNQGAARAAGRMGTQCACSCGRSSRPRFEATTTSGSREKKKRSQAQERAAAKRHGGRAVGGSGASHLAKGDVRARGLMRGECKYTDKKSFSLKLDELVKLEGEAHGGEAPIFEIQFDSASPPRRYYVMPDWHYHQLTHNEEE